MCAALMRLLDRNSVQRGHIERQHMHFWRIDDVALLLASLVEQIRNDPVDSQLVIQQSKDAEQASSSKGKFVCHPS